MSHVDRRPQSYSHSNHMILCMSHNHPVFFVDIGNNQFHAENGLDFIRYFYLKVECVTNGCTVFEGIKRG